MIASGSRPAGLLFALHLPATVVIDLAQFLSSRIEKALLLLAGDYPTGQHVDAVREGNYRRAVE